jgi:hypothetical protein
VAEHLPSVQRLQAQSPAPQKIIEELGEKMMQFALDKEVKCLHEF